MGDEEHPIPLHRGVWGVGELKVVLTHLINLINRHFPLVTFGSDSNLWVFVEEVLQVVREVNDTLLHVGDVAPSIELNFTQELGVICHLRQFAYFFNSVCEVVQFGCNFRFEISRIGKGKVRGEVTLCST